MEGKMVEHLDLDSRAREAFVIAHEIGAWQQRFDAAREAFDVAARRKGADARTPAIELRAVRKAFSVARHVYAGVLDQASTVLGATDGGTMTAREQRLWSAVRATIADAAPAELLRYARAAAGERDPAYCQMAIRVIQKRLAEIETDAATQRAIMAALDALGSTAIGTANDRLRLAITAARQAMTRFDAAVEAAYKAGIFDLAEGEADRAELERLEAEAARQASIAVRAAEAAAALRQRLGGVS